MLYNDGKLKYYDSRSQADEKGSLDLRFFALQDAGLGVRAGVRVGVSVRVRVRGRVCVQVRVRVRVRAARLRAAGDGR